MSYHHGDLRAALLEAAAEILEDRGPEGLSLRAAAQRIGVSHGAPAHHFGDKRGLLTALAAQVVRHWEARLHEVRHEVADADPPGQVVALLQAYVDIARENPQQFRLHTHPQLLDLSDGELREARAGLGGIIDGVLEQACESGWLDRQDLQAVRFAMSALVRGYAAIITDGVPHYGAETPEEDVRTLAEGAASAFELFARSTMHPPGR